MTVVDVFCSLLARSLVNVPCTNSESWWWEGQSLAHAACRTLASSPTSGDLYYYFKVENVQRRNLVGCTWSGVAERPRITPSAPAQGLFPIATIGDYPCARYNSIWWV
jgi:hypothetical protein